jgi:hypothetical protein
MTPNEIDRHVLAAINSGKTRASSIEAYVTHQIGEHGALGDEKPFRTIDRSLQRLRRTGVIQYVSPVQGWRALPSP